MRINIKSIGQIESLVLCKVSRQPIMELPTSTIVSIERTIDEVDKLTLKINKYIISQDGRKKINNLAYDEIKPKRYLLLNNNEYFIIEEIRVNKINGSLEVIAMSGEQILIRRPIDMEDFGVQILDDDIEQDIYSLNSLLKEVGWSLNYIDPSIVYNKDESPRMRWQESVNTNYMEFIKNDLAEQFNFLPIFDSVNRKIDLLNLDTIGEEIKICLSKDNYVKSKTKTNNSEELITLLKLKGNEELDIGRYIIGGYDFLMDFSYFKETKEMSDELISALDKYDEMIKIRTPIWQELTEEKVSKETELALNRTKWQISISQIECYKRLIEQYILKEFVVEENETRVKLSQEMDNELILRLKIEDLLNEIQLLDESIDNINLLCKFETCTDENGNLVFNEELLMELQEFIFVDVYSDDSFVNADDLIEKGKSVLEEKSRPTIEVDIDSVNFLNRLVDNGYRLKWNGVLQFGDIVVLIDEDTDEEEYFYFLGFSIDYSNNTLNLKISNKKSSRSNTRTINEYLKEMKKTKELLMNNRYLFNKTKQNRLNINKDVKKQIEKVTTFIINSNYSRKPKSLEMLNYIKE